TTIPWRKATRVGIDEIAKSPASCCWASVSILPKTMSELASAACSYTGANCLHGPHQSAQKSRRTISLSLMVDSKLSCVISIVDMRVSLVGADECSLDSREHGVLPIGGQRLTAAGAGSRPAPAAKGADGTAGRVRAGRTRGGRPAWNPPARKVRDPPR